MAGKSIGMQRYVLEQDFFYKSGKIKTCRPVIVSIIGDQPLAEFEGQLNKLDYAVGRFSTYAYPNSAGRWRSEATQVIPCAAMGLIFITTQSEAALEAFESEVRSYWDESITTLIAWPGRTRFGMCMKRRLAQYDKPRHFVSLTKGYPDQPPLVNEFPRTTLAFIEALLVAGTYPGVCWLDPLAIPSAFWWDSRTSVRTLTFEDHSFKKLMEHVRIERRPNSNYPTVLATLIGPPSLKAKHIGDVTRFVCGKIPDAAPVIFAAFADATRNRFVLYLTIFE